MPFILVIMIIAAGILYIIDSTIIGFASVLVFFFLISIDGRYIGLVNRYIFREKKFILDEDDEFIYEGNTGWMTSTCFGEQEKIFGKTMYRGRTGRVSLTNKKLVINRTVLSHLYSVNLSDICEQRVKWGPFMDSIVLRVDEEGRGHCEMSFAVTPGLQKNDLIKLFKQYT